MRITSLAYDVCGFIVMLVVLSGVLADGKRNLRNKIFLALVLVQEIFFAIEMINTRFFVPGDDVYSILSFILSPIIVLWFALLMCYLIAYLQERGVNLWRYLYLLGVFCATWMIVSAASYATGNLYIFYNGRYYPGKMYYVLYAGIVILLLYYGFLCVYYRKLLGRRNASALLSYMVVPVAVVLIDVYHNSNYLPFAQSVCVLTCYCLVQHNEIERAERERIKVLQESAVEQEEQIRKSMLLNQELQRAKDNISRAYGMVEGLSREYYAIWLVDKETLRLELIRASGEASIKEAVKVGLNILDYPRVSKWYIDNYVEPEDRERLKKAADITEVLRQMEENSIYSINFLRRDQNGNLGYHQITFSDADTSDGRGQLVFAFRDIDTVVKQEQAIKKELTEAKLLAEEASMAKTRFLFSMSHDIRTPMNAITGFTDLLEKHLEDKEKATDYIGKIRTSSNFLLSLINNVLEVAKIESGRMNLDETVCRTGAVAEEIVTIFSERMERKEIDFKYSGNIRTKYIFIDEVKINEIMLNLVSNAYKYTPAGGKVSLTIDELRSEREGYARFKVKISDSGIGMAKDFQEQIFDEFSREKTTTEDGIEGTGLGMAITKRLVELMGGTISVESEPGKGTTFVMNLLLRKAAKGEYEDKSETNIVPHNFAGKRILLAEDNDLNAEIALELLRDAGFMVERANDGVICIDMLQKAEAGFYDVLLMDIQMPHMDGYKATQHIRSMSDVTKRDIPIIAMTANAYEEDRRYALEVGMNAHVAKPIKFRELYDVIAGVLA